MFEGFELDFLGDGFFGDFGRFVEGGGFFVEVGEGAEVGDRVVHAQVKAGFVWEIRTNLCRSIEQI